DQHDGRTLAAYDQPDFSAVLRASRARVSNVSFHDAPGAQPGPHAGARRAVIAAMQAAVGQRGTEGADAARSQDFLYGDDGLPK
ncbi:MAG: hypothetical protein J4G15_16980, partial [Alphaproteobacteria bacterium]|nr:hypothetical protein [Alphaproteobacteria bacterium]